MGSRRDPGLKTRRAPGRADVAARVDLAQRRAHRHRPAAVRIESPGGQTPLIEGTDPSYWKISTTVYQSTPTRALLIELAVLL